MTKIRSRVVRSRVVGCGHYLPARIVTNRELAERLDTSDQWITERTGIRQRHIAATGEYTSHLAIAAGQRALANAQATAGDLDLILVATATPDVVFPATATRVQHALGMRHGMAFDIQAVCAGFVYALAVADNFIRTGQVRTALVIGAETFSRILDWDDRATCVLFGDGSGAVVLRAADSDGAADERGILSTHLHADGQYHDLLYVDGGPSATRTVGKLRMAGREVFRHAVDKMAGAVQEALEANRLEASAIDWFVPHQANRRIIDGTARKLRIPPDHVAVTIDRHANTSAASIPLALSELAADGRLQQNHLVLLEALGGGFTWGSCLIRW